MGTETKRLKLMNTSTNKKKLKASAILLLANSINKDKHLKMECQVVKLILDQLLKKLTRKIHHLLIYLTYKPILYIFTILHKNQYFKSQSIAYLDIIKSLYFCKKKSYRLRKKILMLMQNGK